MQYYDLEEACFCAINKIPLPKSIVTDKTNKEAVENLFQKSKLAKNLIEAPISKELDWIPWRQIKSQLLSQL